MFSSHHPHAPDDEHSVCLGQVQAPPGALKLFDGSSLRGWQSSEGGPPRWHVEGGILEVVPGAGDLVTERIFSAGQLHLEFWIPELPDHVTGQARGNSGVYLLGRYELQILDSYRQRPSLDSCGAIYGQRAPLRDACAPPGQWQGFDVVFHPPILDTNGLITAPARVTVIHNGILIHNHVCLRHPTQGALDEYEAQPGPLRLQDHGNRVRFRNIWLLPDEGGGTGCAVDDPG